MSNSSQDEFNPTNLQMLVAEVNKTASSSMHSAQFQVPLRIAFHLHSRVEALTQHLGVSRNKVLNDLIAVGLDSLFDSLSPDVVADLWAKAAIKNEELLKDKSVTSGEI